MTESVLKVEHLGIAFGGLKAVEDFHLEIGKSELVGLIGPNGAGKTTIFNLLTGVYQPTEGAIYLDGVPMVGKKPHQMVAAGIARTFQNIRLFKELTVLENVMVSFNHTMKYSILSGILRTKNYWKEEAAAQRRALDLLRVMHMEDYADQVAANLPYGQQRKLEIARALATGAKILLLDEPAAGMNPTETTQLMDAIQTIREKFQISVLLIEHDMSLVMSVCERIVVIDYGHIIATGTPFEIANNPKVIGAYLGTDDQ
ncbi:ABC transporter ATP-binding protein [Clostridiaceae bacterium NSJ-31]|uniref:ABC transporter ATP-binding protein n=1 Tax=Ligaoa zhengdingensis TaxID=2763658 RepID=A0A926I540_9FIRM|nr:ABC transporter ATP-binding protein [Ligaoa zhengdingensis]MBC8547055.1 ABC transporter ATP-binding protein [Ligaoa zhengdingensis]